MAEERLLAVSPNLPAGMERPKWSLRDYHVLQTLYNGYAAQVYTATCKYTGLEVVLKVYSDVDKAPDVAQHEMYREVAIQSGLQHNNIVHLFAAFEEGSTLVLVQEYAPSGDLLGLMQSHGGRVDEATVVKAVLRPLLGALMYLHRWGIVHRDVKPENVLFAADGTVKLADFGLAINMIEERPISRVGTLDYMAPEVLRCPVKQSMAMAPKPGSAARYGYATDVWAVGIVTFELLTGLPPYASECRYQAESRICAGQPPLFPSSISPMARDFILRLLAPVPGDRPTVRQMLEHPWIANPDACVAQARAHMQRSLAPIAMSVPVSAAAAAASGYGVADYHHPAFLPGSSHHYSSYISAAAHADVGSSGNNSSSGCGGGFPVHGACAKAPGSSSSPTAASDCNTLSSSSSVLLNSARLPAIQQHHKKLQPDSSSSAPDHHQPHAIAPAAAASSRPTEQQQHPRSSTNNDASNSGNASAASKPQSNLKPHPPPPQPHGSNRPHHIAVTATAAASSASQQQHPRSSAGGDTAANAAAQQLRGLQAIQVVDLSRLPVDQLQGVIKKLQQAMQLAALQQQVDANNVAAAAAGCVVVRGSVGGAGKATSPSDGGSAVAPPSPTPKPATRAYPSEAGCGFDGRAGDVDMTEAGAQHRTAADAAVMASMMHRSSGGGAPSEGDGTVYVSIGSTRKVAQCGGDGSMGGATCNVAAWLKQLTAM